MKQKKDKDTHETSFEKYFSKEEAYIKIRVALTPSRHLFLPATLNGVEGKFILDTGAGATVLELNKKDAFHLKSENMEETATGAGGSGMRLETSKNNIFQIGALILDNFEIFLMNLDHVNEAFMEKGLDEVDGVIGADILTAREAIIDYAHMILYLKEVKK